MFAWMILQVHDQYRYSTSVFKATSFNLYAIYIHHPCFFIFNIRYISLLLYYSISPHFSTYAEHMGQTGPIHIKISHTNLLWSINHYFLIFSQKSISWFSSEDWSHHYHKEFKNLLEYKPIYILSGVKINGLQMLCTMALEKMNTAVLWTGQLAL